MIIQPVSPNQLRQRRQQLQRQRKVKLWQGLWRTLFMGGIAGSLFWVVMLPNWVIRQPEQIAIEGNQFLSASSVRSLLSLSYPQSLLKLQPQGLAQALEETAPIADAVVTRELFPPSLSIKVQERVPVAIALPNPNGHSEMGFVDESGIWIPQSNYTTLDSELEIPKLQVSGLDSSLFRHWSKLYPLIHHSTVQVSLVNFQDESNVILDTEFGKVHLGGNTGQWEEQLRVLAQMGELPNQVPPSEIDYIDLQTPSSPKIQLKTPSERLNTPSEP